MAHWVGRPCVRVHRVVVLRVCNHRPTAMTPAAAPLTSGQHGRRRRQRANAAASGHLSISKARGLDAQSPDLAARVAA
jgi:hypothetical protein